MAMSYSEIEDLIDSGQAADAVREFITFSVTLSVGVRTGKMQELPGVNATIVAGVVLQKLIDTTEGRRLLGIKASNKVYNAKDYPMDSPHLDIARRLVIGELSQPDALKELAELLHKAQIYPDQKSLKRLLRDLEDQATDVQESLEYLMKVAGWDGNTQTLRQSLDSLTKRQSGR